MSELKDGDASISPTKKNFHCSVESDLSKRKGFVVAAFGGELLGSKDERRVRR